MPMLRWFSFQPRLSQAPRDTPASWWMGVSSMPECAEVWPAPLANVASAAAKVPSIQCRTMSVIGTPLRLAWLGDGFEMMVMRSALSRALVEVQCPDDPRQREGGTRSHAQPEHDGYEQQGRGMVDRAHA